MLRTVRMLAQQYRILVMGTMAYRTNFLIATLIVLSFQAVGPIVQLLIFTQTRGFPGWSLSQILLFNGIGAISIGLNGMFLAQLPTVLSRLVLEGELDRVLTRPCHPLLSVIAMCFDFAHVSGILAGLVVVCVSLSRIGIAVSAPCLLLCLAYMGVAFALYLVFQVLASIAVIYTLSTQASALLSTLRRFGHYPLELYSARAQIVFSSVLPVSLIAYYPAQALLGRPAAYGSMAVAFTVAGLVASIMMLNSVLCRYTSAGG